MKPKDYELAVKQWLEATFFNVRDLEIRHDEHIDAYDGEYQIDISGEFAMGDFVARFIVECKHKQKRSVERSDVIVLNQKIQSTNRNIGILVTTTDFQSGAKDFAIEHGIKLAILSEETWSTVVKAHTDHEASHEEVHGLLFFNGHEYVDVLDPDVFESVIGIEHGSRVLTRILEGQQ